MSQLLSVWRTSLTEITIRCGSDARDYLQVQKLCLIALFVAAIPGACVLLPVAIKLGKKNGEWNTMRENTRGDGSHSGYTSHHQSYGQTVINGDAQWFAQTTIHHFPNESPFLWLAVLTSIITLIAIETVADTIQNTLVRHRFVSAELGASIAGSTLMLRRVPRAVCFNPKSLKRALSARFPGRIYSVVVPLDGTEAKARRKVAVMRAAVSAARCEAARRRAGSHQRASSSARLNTQGTTGFEQLTQNLLVADDSNNSDSFYDSKVTAALRNSLTAENDLSRLIALRKEKGTFTPNPGCCFVVFKDPLTARRALKALRPSAVGTLLSFLSPALPFYVLKKLGPKFKAGVDMDNDGGGGETRDSTAQGLDVVPSEGENSESVDGSDGTPPRAVSPSPDEPRSSFSPSRRSPNMDTIKGSFASQARERRERNQEARESRGFDVLTETLLEVRGNDGEINDDGPSTSSSPHLFFTPGLNPHTNHKMPRAVALAIGFGVHHWRVDHAPPPSGILWDNVGVTPGTRFLLACLVNLGVFLGLVFMSSPLAVFSYCGEVAASLDPQIDWRWTAWLNWATNKGGPTAGLLFQFIPNILTLVTIYLLIPKALEKTTLLEKHLTRSGALRSLVSKEFWYFLINILLLLALGKAALSAVVEQIRECQWHSVRDACELKFIKILGESFVAEAAMSLCGFLVSCCTIGPAWELLSLFSWIAEVAWDQKVKRDREGAMGSWAMGNYPEGVELRDGNDAIGTPQQVTPRRSDTNSFANATPGPSHRQPLNGCILHPSPNPALAKRKFSKRKPVFDLPGQHAFNATVLACTVTFASLAPVLLLPGMVFFAIRYFVHKHNLLCLHLDAVAGAGESSDLFGSGAGGVVHSNDDGSYESISYEQIDSTNANKHENSKKASDGRLLATVVKTIRVSALLHATVMAAFLYIRGTSAQKSVQCVLWVAVVCRRRVEQVFHGTGRGRNGSNPSIFTNNSQAADDAVHRGGHFLHAGAGVVASEAVLGGITDTQTSLDTDPSILNEHTRYKGPFVDRGVGEEAHVNSR